MKTPKKPSPVQKTYHYKEQKRFFSNVSVKTKSKMEINL